MLTLMLKPEALTIVQIAKTVRVVHRIEMACHQQINRHGGSWVEPRPIAENEITNLAGTSR